MLSETISVYTRRDALRFSMSFAALPLFASANIFAATKDFWDAKASTDWNAEEVNRMLTKSPWAKDASVSFNGGPGGFGTPSSRRGGYGYPGGGIGFPGGGLGYPGSGRYPGGNPNGYPPGTSPGGGRESYRATVRWESAQPIQDALHLDTPDRKPDPDFAKYYVLQVLGDLPDLGAARNRRRNNDDDQRDDGDDDDRSQQATNERRLEMFKQYTKIEKRDGFLRLEKVEQGSRTSARGPGTLFYFSREDEISPDDRGLTFVTKMGPVEIKAKFTPKEMRYHGKLAV